MKRFMGICVKYKLRYCPDISKQNHNLLEKCLDARSEGTGTGTLTEHSDTTTFSKCLIAIRRFFTFIFSHVGLLSLVVGYCILGGITFEHLEKENELQVKVK